MILVDLINGLFPLIIRNMIPGPCPSPSGKSPVRTQPAHSSPSTACRCAPPINLAHCARGTSPACTKLNRQHGQKRQIMPRLYTISRRCPTRAITRSITLVPGRTRCIQSSNPCKVNCPHQHCANACCAPLSALNEFAVHDAAGGPRSAPSLPSVTRCDQA